jgi:hypothetical protein
MPHFKDSENKVYWLDEGDDPAVWLPNCTSITDAEAETLRVAQEAADLAAYMNTLDYAQKRRLEYPPVADYLDGVVKGDQAQIDKYIADCLAVKIKYPKGV